MGSLWLNNFGSRLTQLEDWMGNPMELPKVTWISGLVNPQSFLTAISQVTAQRNMWELDKLCTFTDVRKWLTVDEVEAASRDAAYIIGMSMQGARWNGTDSTIEKSKPKEMFCTMPVISVRGVLVAKADLHLLRAAQNQVASGPLGAGRRRDGDGGSVGLWTCVCWLVACSFAFFCMAGGRCLHGGGSCRLVWPLRKGAAG